MTSRFKLLISSLSVLCCAPVLAQDVNCSGTINADEIDGNVDIAQPCEIYGTEIEGNIRLFAGGSLVANNIVVDGNIDAEDADYVDIRNSEIDGKLQLDEMVGDFSRIQDSSIGDDLEIKDSRSRFEVLRNFVEDDLKVNENSGAVLIVDNIVDGDLECRRNSPEPEGANNDVGGNQKNQCRQLQAPQLPDDPVEPPSEPPPPPPDEPVNGGGGVGLTPPDAINTGTGGGAALAPWSLLFLLSAVAATVNRRR